MLWLSFTELTLTLTLTLTQRVRLGTRMLWLSFTELFDFKYMQTDPNWSNFLYDARTGQISLIDFGACQPYDAAFADEYLRMVRSCAEGVSEREAILTHSTNLGFLTGEENTTMLDAHVSAMIHVPT